ncbi:dead end protein 1 [Boleophthalmus pectinirostris]|uniref:dead end protein 1 n=1 Tax=Boleophthalmus pectinirostris TaxID=150288 RepID=UPI002432A550|nr:dead end protein 1 [Boleophthalmus pectinirostris]
MHCYYCYKDNIKYQWFDCSHPYSNLLGPQGAYLRLWRVQQTQVQARARCGVTVREHKPTVDNMDCKRSQVLNPVRVQALETWVKNTKIRLTQVNGQRRYGGPPEGWDGPMPGARCEVFISQIPRDVYEDLLIPLFSSVGPLWEFRLMMNFSGQNRGFAYAKYGSAAIATEAIRTLNGYMIESGCYLSVRRSTEKRQLCMGGLPRVTQQEQLLQVLQGLIEGVERVSLKAGPGIEGVSAIVVFTSHHAASMAKKVLVEAFKKHFSLSVSIKWQSSGKPSPEEPMHSQKAFFTSPTKPPRLLPRPQPPSLPSPFLHTPSIPPGFCRTVGGPAAQLQIPMPRRFFSLPPPLLDHLPQYP